MRYKEQIEALTCTLGDIRADLTAENRLFLGRRMRVSFIRSTNMFLSLVLMVGDHPGAVVDDLLVRGNLQPRTG